MKKGSKHTEESKMKISLNNGMCQEVVEKIRMAKIGSRLTESHKIKISQALTGVKKSKIHRLNIGKVKIGNKYRLGMKNSEQHNEALRRSNIMRVVSDESRRKMSEKRLGKKLSQETILKIKKVGEDHWNWKGGVTGMGYASEWTKLLKYYIRMRDDFSCQKCGVKQIGKISFDVHHIDLNKKNCDEDNLITLCKSCHIKTHNFKITQIQ